MKAALLLVGLCLGLIGGYFAGVWRERRREPIAKIYHVDWKQTAIENEKRAIFFRKALMKTNSMQELCSTNYATLILKDGSIGIWATKESWDHSVELMKAGKVSCVFMGDVESMSFEPIKR